MYKSADAKKAYFQERYQNNKDRYKEANKNFWVKYAREQLNKEDVTDEEIRRCKNEYYKQYRREHSTIVKKNMDNFWKRKAMEQDALRKEFLQDEG